MNTQFTTIPNLILQIANSKPSRKVAGVCAEDNPLCPNGFQVLTKEFFHGPVAIDPPHPLVRPGRVDRDIAARPTELKRFPNPGAPKVRDNERHFRKVFRHIVQFERVDVLVPVPVPAGPGLVW